MKRVSAHVSATVLISLALFGFTNLAVYANFDPQPNPNNRGHHYGWYKNNHSPVPVPPPNPVPAPAPGGASTGRPGSVTASHPSHPAPTNVPLPAFGVQLDIPVRDLVPAAQGSASDVKFAVPDGGDPWWWLVLLLPPALAALWGIAFRRLAINGAAARAQPAAGAA